MKKILFLTTIALAAISCQDEESNLQVSSTSPVSNKFQVVQITNQGEIIPLDNGKTKSLIEAETALQFVSEADYQSALAEISNMNSESKLSFVASNDFASLQELAIQADKELDEIENEATSESDFRAKYAQYVEKYSGKLITNQYDSEDLTLYVPNGDNLSTYLINKNQKVVIGNQIRTITLNNDMSASDKILYAPASRAGETNQFTFKEVVGKMKTTGSVTIEASAAIRVHIGCQKKLWYGWRRDNHRDIYYQINASPMHYTVPNAKGDVQEVPYVQYHVFRNDGDFSFFVGGLMPGKPQIKGNLKVWTDATVANVNDLVEYNNVFVRYEGKFGSFGKYKLPRLGTTRAYGGEFTLTKTI